MLQIIVQTNEKYSIAEQVQMAIEGGCTWVRLDMPEAADEQVREVAMEVIPLCRESATILTIDDRYELARELGVHGVVVDGAKMDAGAVRESLVPEAIIGVRVASSAAIVALRGKDVDFCELSAKTSKEEMAQIVAEVRAADVEMPIVASGDIPLDKLSEVMTTGVNGVALTKSITDSHDPVKATEEALAILKANM